MFISLPTKITFRALHRIQQHKHSCLHNFHENYKFFLTPVIILFFQNLLILSLKLVFSSLERETCYAFLTSLKHETYLNSLSLTPNLCYPNYTISTQLVSFYLLKTEKLVTFVFVGKYVLHVAHLMLFIGQSSILVCVFDFKKITKHVTEFYGLVLRFYFALKT